MIQYFQNPFPLPVYKIDKQFILRGPILFATFVTIKVTIMNNRLKQFLAAENITQAQFADNINVVRASVSHVLSGRNNPSYEFIRSIMEKYPELNIEWLMFGNGKMYKSNHLQEEPKPVADNSPVDVLFPAYDEPVQEYEIPVQPVQAPAIPEIPVTQRKVSKIIVLFDDGSFQEM